MAAATGPDLPDTSPEIIESLRMAFVLLQVSDCGGVMMGDTVPQVSDSLRLNYHRMNISSRRDLIKFLNRYQ